MKIEIVGTGCPKCKALENNTKMALNNLGQEAEIVKVNEVEDIISKGIMVTPAIIIDGKLISQGKLLSSDEIQKVIKK